MTLGRWSQVARGIALAGLTALCLLGEARAAPHPHPRWTLSFGGFGPVRVGMTVAQAQRALGFRLHEGRVTDPDECHYAISETRIPGIGFMIVDGRIARIDVTKGRTRTVSGARVGMTEEEARRLYPRVEVQPHKYVPGGHYLVLTSRDGRHGLVLETDGRVVTQLRAGEREAVSWVERCS